MSEQQPKVSVLMITYNHEHYIAQAIESVLMQQTDFSFEIVIGEDCSTDRTREIVLDFQRRFPDKIRTLLPDANLGMHENFFQTLRACQGQYIALLEGDDYWTSSQKLQVQVDFLDNHADYVLCFHQVLVISEQDEFVPFINPSNLRYQILQIQDMISSNPIITCSVVFKNNIIKEFPRRLLSLKMVDWPLFLLLANYGKFRFIETQMATYRLHETGVWSLKGSTWKLREMVRAQECMRAYIPRKLQKNINNSIVNRYYRLALEYREQGDLINAVDCMRLAIFSIDFYPSDIKHWIGAFSAVFFPKIYRSITVMRGYYKK